MGLHAVTGSFDRNHPSATEWVKNSKGLPVVVTIEFADDLGMHRRVTLHCSDNQFLKTLLFSFLFWPRQQAR
jgi:hypothetical protein